MSRFDDPTFYVVNGNPQVAHMMSIYGYNRVQDITKAAVVLFTGGPDLHPMFYGERVNHHVVSDYARDLLDIRAYRSLQDEQVPVGICRGAQFLNVFAGNGRLYQHVDKHALPVHDYHMAVLNTPVAGAPAAVRVNSTHHQMMIPGPNADVWLYSREATVKYGEDSNKPLVKHKNMTDQYDDKDPEAVYIWTPTHSNGVLCYQPHPEYIEDPGNDVNTNLFFSLLENGSLITKDLLDQIDDNRSKRLPSFLDKRQERIDEAKKANKNKAM